MQSCYATAPDEFSFYDCIDGCYASMNDQALALMDSLVMCSDALCPNVPGSIDNLYQCQQDLCPTQYNACMGQ